MATVYRENKERSKRQYISTAAFNANFYTYVVSQNPTTFVTTGTLAANVTGATAATCPAGRVLRETGRRLFPGAHPGINTLMVMVYDNVSLLNGFIDPNSNLFAVFNSDKPWEVVDGTDLSGGLVHRGQSVFTSGNVTAVGQIRSSTVTTLAAQTLSTGSATIPITINPTLGQVFTQTFSITGGTNSFTIGTAASPAAGTVVYLILKTDSSHTTAASVAKGSNVIMQTVVLGTAASRTFGLTLVSDGTNLVQVGGDIVPTAMA